MLIQDDTQALRELYNVEPGGGEIESMHQAELDGEMALALMANPKAALQAMNVPVSDESVVNVTMQNRALRGQQPLSAPTQRVRRIIVIVIHYRNCDSTVIIIGLQQ